MTINAQKNSVANALRAFQQGGDTRLLKRELRRGNHYAKAKLDFMGLEWADGAIRRKGAK